MPTIAVADAPGGAASQWVRLPQQARARQTFERVLDAAAQLLAERAYEGFSMAEVCRRARVSPGALYDRVDSKDSLFLAVHERELDRMAGSARAAFAPSDRWSVLTTRELVGEAIRALARHYLADQGLLRAFILRAAVDDRVRTEGSRLARRTATAVIELLRTRADDYPHPDPDAAVRTAYRMAADSLSWRTAFGLDFAATDEETTEQWIEQLCAVCCTYLMTPPA
jgi:AcrR family transcriptional regulator